ncbi:MAG TPA: hypothetical protein VF062_22780 [Candidatus Limnocylindrales bacterium]
MKGAGSSGFGSGPGRHRVPAPVFLPGDILWSLVAMVVWVMLSVLAVNPRWAAVFSQRLRGLEARITGNERGSDVLAGKKSGRAGALTLTVDQVLLTPHFTRIVVTVSNNGLAPVELPGAGRWRLLTHTGTVLQGSAFRSLWPDAVPPHWSSAGIVTFGRLPEGTGHISLGLGGVADAGAGALTLADIPLRPA